jgi:hypothetical protein
MPTNLDQLQSADDGQGEQCSPTSSDISHDRQTQLLSREQSFARVAAENQHAKREPFQAWAVDTGQWGGRELTPGDPDPLKSLPSVTEVSLQDWMAASETEPFTMISRPLVGWNLLSRLCCRYRLALVRLPITHIVWTPGPAHSRSPI